MNNTFPTTLSTLRKAANLTNKQLAQKSGVPRSFIAGLQSGKRRIGELQARKIGVALGLEGEALEQFVLHAIDTCTEKLLKRVLEFPADLLNLLGQQLINAGIYADSILTYAIVSADDSNVITLLLNDGTKAKFTANLQMAA